MRQLLRERVSAFAHRLREIPFVRDVRYEASKDRVAGSDGLLTIIDKKNRRFPFLLQIKLSYFDLASTNASIVSARLAQRAIHFQTLILARYIPQPTADRLIEAGINFVDLVGNMHLDLNDFSRII